MKTQLNLVGLCVLAGLMSGCGLSEIAQTGSMIGKFNQAVPLENVAKIGANQMQGEMLNKATELGSTIGGGAATGSTNFDTALQNAQVHFSAGRYEQALEKLNEALALIEKAKRAR